MSNTEDTWSAKSIHRPQLLKDFIGQDQVIDIIKGQIKAGKFSKSYLITAPKGCGKTSLSRVLAKKITGLKTHKHVDVIEYNAVVNTGIDRVRALLERLKYQPMEADKKVVLIDECHGLTTNAASGLLEILENPPDYVVFILSTTEPQNILPTIKDRCKKLELKPLNAENIKLLLTRAAEREEVFQPASKHDKLFDVLSSMYVGRNRDALNTLSNLADIARSRKITKDDIVDVLEKTGINYADAPKFLGLMYTGKPREAFEILDRVEDYNSFTYNLLDLNTYAIKRATGLTTKFNYSAKILFNYIKKADIERLNRFQEILINLRRDITQASAIAPDAILVYYTVKLGEV